MRLLVPVLLIATVAAALVCSVIADAVNAAIVATIAGF